MSKFKRPERRYEIEDVQQLIESVPTEYTEKVAKITIDMMKHPSYGEPYVF